jgi:large subunit ribosomal protein L4e
MKTAILDISGKEKGKIDLPKCFDSKIREDIVQKVVESKKTIQPYAPSPVAGMQYSARGKIRHRRHVWQTHYGRGMSRVPRKVMSRRGTQFNWVAASVPFARGGIRAHPPKIAALINTKRINKKEMEIAINSAISATANKKYISQKYERLNVEDIKNTPFVVESKITKIKTKELLKAIKEILGKKISEVAMKKKSQRAGKGKMRGRKYKVTSGLLIVTGEKEKMKANVFDTVNAKKLGVVNLANGGLGRLTLYTEDAIKYLETKNKK